MKKTKGICDECEYGNFKHSFECSKYKDKNFDEEDEEEDPLEIDEDIEE